MFGVASTADTIDVARALAPVEVIWLSTADGVEPAGATISASALTPPATKRRSELFRASSRRLFFLTNFTLTYPTGTPAAVAKLSVTLVFKLRITVGLAMSSSNLIAAGRAMATVTT